MELLNYLRTIFSTETDAEKLEQFIVKNNPQTVGEVESLTRIFDRRQTMQ